ncbi:MAG: nucleotide exchange factor GrpE [Pseudomonadota bacterium]
MAENTNQTPPNEGPHAKAGSQSAANDADPNGQTAGGGSAAPEEAATDANGATPQGAKPQGAKPQGAKADGDVAALAEEVAGLKDQLLRALAETENVRRRADRDKDDAKRFAAANFAKDLLSVADNFHRALESVTEEILAEHPPLKPIIEGVRMTQKEMLTVFERHGIKKIDAIGQKLDPNRHQAVFEVPDESQPPGTVVQELQAGYVLHERLLRPAMVGVAKGGKPAPAPDADA